MTLNLLIFSTDIMYILNPCCLCSVALWNILYRNSVPFQKFIRKYQIFKDFSRNFAMSENKSAFSGIYMVSLVQIGNIRIRTNFRKKHCSILENQDCISITSLKRRLSSPKSNLFYLHNKTLIKRVGPYSIAKQFNTNQMNNCGND